jgi:murein DD-endopeptidase MepM/ murein hydrolase activator NlpD
MENKNNSFFKKLVYKYKLVAVKEASFEELWHIRISNANIITILLAGGLMIFALSFLLFSYSPLQYLLPSYGKDVFGKRYLKSIALADSLVTKIEMQEHYIYNIMLLLKNDTNAFKKTHTQKIASDTISLNQLSFKKSNNDSILRDMIEDEYVQNKLTFTDDKAFMHLTKAMMISPVNGFILDSFNIQKKHYGVDVIASDKSNIKSVLPGTVIFSNWDYNTGFTVLIQHADDVLSSYKHCESVLKEVGDEVKTGDVIGLIGNSGKYTSGPHLHFELWENGKPINPSNYIIFKENSL